MGGRRALTCPGWAAALGPGLLHILLGWAWQGWVGPRMGLGWAWLGWDGPGLGLGWAW